MSFIEINDVTFQYGTQSDDEYAVRDVDFTVERGEFVGITGRSEAGKATLCRLIAGQIPHFYHGELVGDVTIEGVPTVDSSVGDLAKQTGYVFENPYDQLTGATSTVLEEVAFGLETHGFTREEIRERARESLAAIGVEELADRDPSQLSGGQCQRVAIASVIAMRPDVLVLQQPTAQLDPQGTEEVLNVVSGMNDEGYTVVMVSHELEQLAPHLDRLAIMEEGQVRLEGSPQEVLVQASEENLPISIPKPVDIGHWLRDSDLIPSGNPIPVTEEDCLAELKQAVKHPLPDGDDGRNRSDAMRGAFDESDRVVIDDLHHQYPSGVKALSGVSLSFNEGCVCLIGQNGAGKSTLVKHLNGLLHPTSGVVRIQGTDIKESATAELARKVGLSFQNPDDQLFHKTVESEVSYGPRNLDMDDDEVDRLTDQALELLGLTDRRGANPYDLGEPWRKRVAVASVVAMDTPIVVLDEPTSGQDAPGYEQLGSTVEALVDSGKLVIVVTHDMDFVREYADRTVLLAQGEVIADGDTRDVLGDPETLARSNVHPPTITRMGLNLGVGPVLHLDELLDAIGRQNDDVSA